MKKLFRYGKAFSLPEVIISLAVFAVVGAVVAITSSSLIRSFAFTEEYAAAQGTMNRVLDHLAMDLRSAQGVSFKGAVITTGTHTLGSMEDLVIERPGFYKNDNESDLATFDLVAAGKGVMYGTSTTLASPQKITYRRIPGPDGFDVITRNDVPVAEFATNLTIRFTALTNGREFQISTVYFSNQRRSTAAHIRSDVQVMLRNPRTDI